ncbi:MAG: intradiol ring-cleavage dioxygenase [Rhizobiales bacterium]|nr:intradiol ring-cleavage dioxygenase [Hyphomicrobiales bacterium]
MTKKLMTRRSILQNWLAATAAGLAASLPRVSAQAQTLQTTPFCDDQTAPTIAGTEGPFYTPRTPRKTDFRQDAAGDALTLTGFVVTRECKPIADALIDLWHADAEGEYDNEGYKLRGHQLTDAEGRYVFETIIPAPYSRRTRHYHVKVTAPGGRVLTTQLYFPGEEGNGNDFLFNERLLMRVVNASDGKVGRFDFVLDG